MDRVISLHSLVLESFQAWSQGSQYGGTELPLAETWGAQFLGFHLETLDPGKFSCPYHLHRGEEELFIAIKGSCVLREDGKFRRIRAGDLVFFPVGVLHQFFNPGPEPFLFFALSNRNSQDVCEYPDSRKKLIRHPRQLFQDGQPIQDYWAGEEDPASFWPAAWLKPE
jgi:uncharacterized cupin superfamily protein